MVFSDGIPVVPRNRKSRNSVPNPSAEEKTTRNSVPWTKNRSMLSEFPSEPFSGRENNSEFRSVELNRSRLSEFRSEPFCGRENNSEQKQKTEFGVLSSVADPLNSKSFADYFLKLHLHHVSQIKKS